MQITVSGKQIDIGNSLQSYVKDKIEKDVKKYFDKAILADTVFSKQSHLYRADILVNEGTGTGITIKATAEAADIYQAFEGALMRIDKQLRRYKTRIKNHHKENLAQKINGNEAVKGMKYVLSPFPEEEPETIATEDSPIIIAEKNTNIEVLSVSEAVMKMDLNQLPALLFINYKNGRLNLVYHRLDGNISWVDPQPI